jgi:hypothetical protein
MANVAFVSFANGRYIDSQKKLIWSVRRRGYDMLAFNDFAEIGSPTHVESPYAFKLYSIEAARKKGYDIVIWCDSPFRLVRPIEPWIAEIKKRGVYLQRDGFTIGQWANDKALTAFGLTRDQALKLPNVYASIMAFDFSNPITHTFLRRLRECSDAGLFRGKWNNREKTESQDERCLGHRHDQTCAELVANELGIEHGPPTVGDASATSRYFTSWDNP